MKVKLSVALALVGVVGSSFSARAQQTFDLSWSGVSLGNSAVATGTITMNPSLLQSGYNDNTGFFLHPANPFVTALSITVSGASSGNGTFTLADFDTVLFNENGSLNFNTELVGQPTAGSPWGTPNGAGGDFNLFNRTGVGGAAPDGSFNFTLHTDHGTEDGMVLTSFRPASAVPEPGSIAMLLGMGLTGAGFLLKKRRR